MKVRELRGTESMAVMNVFNALMLGMLMLPAYRSLQFEEFMGLVARMEPKEQESIVRSAIDFVRMEKEEIESVMRFCADSNGVPYSTENLKNLSPVQISECVLAVCMEYAKLKINLITEAEKKNLADSA